MKKYLSHYSKFAVGIFVFTVALTLTLGTAYGDASSPSGPKAKIAQKVIQRIRNNPRIREAIEVHRKHTRDLMARERVVGTAVGVDRDKPVIKVFTTGPGVQGVPENLDGFPVKVEVTGRIVAFDCPDGPDGWCDRPVPIGVSTGHTAITAGTIGARVTDGTNVFALSNNHVYANSNDASIGDPVLQPGPADGGSYPVDEIGTLDDYEPILFDGSDNYIDAAIALSSRNNLGNAIPDTGVPGEHFTPSAVTVPPEFYMPVKKHGRTTGLTHGAISEIDATVNVCYEVFWFWCLKSAIFVHQIGIAHDDPNTPFSEPGDSGSLIVTEDGNNPVGLLFAGSETYTFANPIDPVLDTLGVWIDSCEGETDDVEVTLVTADPPSVEKGNAVTVEVTVTNVGAENVGPFDVILKDLKDESVIGAQTVENLASGVDLPMTFPWDTSDASVGMHTLEARHNLPCDADSTNDAETTTVEVTGSAVPNTMHIGDLDGTSKKWRWGYWRAIIDITVHDYDEQPVADATVVGSFDDCPGGVECEKFQCTTDSQGTCRVVGWQLWADHLTFTVESVSHATLEYNPDDNYDPDGDSDGTSIYVPRP